MAQLVGLFKNIVEAKPALKTQIFLFVIIANGSHRVFVNKTKNKPFFKIFAVQYGF